MIFDLTKTLAAFLTESLADLWLRAPERAGVTTYPAPKVFIGALPPVGAGGDLEGFPFVIVRPAEGTDDGFDQSQVTVNIVVGVYSAEGHEGGFNDLATLVDRVRRAILQTRTIDGKYRLEPPIKWHIGGEDQNQPAPHYIGVVIATWLMPGVQEELPPEVAAEVFG